MSNNNHAADLKKQITGAIIILSIITVDIAFAQSSSSIQNPSSPPDLNNPPRTIHRTGTAIGARNSISIKSTDAGIIHRQPPASGCTNCGVIDFINKMGQGNSLNAIAGGVVAGTIAREVMRHATPHSHGSNHPNTMSGVPGDHGHTMTNPVNQYNVGITMNDGSQAVITLPNTANLQQGDRVRLVDGVLVPDHP